MSMTVVRIVINLHHREKISSNKHLNLTEFNNPYLNLRKEGVKSTKKFKPIKGKRKFTDDNTTISNLKSSGQPEYEIIIANV